MDTWPRLFQEEDYSSDYNSMITLSASSLSSKLCDASISTPIEIIFDLFSAQSINIGCAFAIKDSHLDIIPLDIIPEGKYKIQSRNIE